MGVQFRSIRLRTCATSAATAATASGLPAVGHHHHQALHPRPPPRWRLPRRLHGRLLYLLQPLAVLLCALGSLLRLSWRSQALMALQCAAAVSRCVHAQAGSIRCSTNWHSRVGWCKMQGGEPCCLATKKSPPLAICLPPGCQRLLHLQAAHLGKENSGHFLPCPPRSLQVNTLIGGALQPSCNVALPSCQPVSPPPLPNKATHRRALGVDQGVDAAQQKRTLAQPAPHLQGL